MNQSKQRSTTIAIVLGLLMSLFFTPAVLADDERSAGTHIVGSWVVNGQPDGAPAFINTATNHRDGTMVNTDPLFGTGHGVWERIGKGRFTVKFVTITSPFNAVLPNAVITVEGNLRLEGQDAASGTFVTTFTDLGGVELFPPSTGVIELGRIGLD